MDVHKLTLTTNKTVYLMPMEVKHYRQAGEAAAYRAKDNMLLFQMYTQEELIKLLVVAVNDKELTRIEAEQIDKQFSPNEYGQVMSAVQEMMGDKNARPKVEMVSYSKGTTSNSPGSPATPA